MKKFLIIFFSILIISCDPPLEDEIIKKYYPNGNLKSEVLIYADGNYGWIKSYYNMVGTKESVILRDTGSLLDGLVNLKNVETFVYPDKILDYYKDGNLYKETSKYSHGKIKSIIKYDRFGDFIAILKYDSRSGEVYGYDQELSSTVFIDKPYGFNDKDGGYKPCKIDKENSIHSWDEFNNGYGGTTWRCRGVDNGQFVDNCNCKNFLKLDTRWTGK